MSHMVMFRSAEGKSGYHQTESLDEAIGFVEHLRNQEQVPEARIFRMEEVAIEVRTYYKVEVSPSPVRGASPTPAVAAPPAPQAAPAPQTAQAPPAPQAPAPPARPATSASAAPAKEKVAVSGDEAVVIEPMAPSNGAGAGTRFGRFNRS